jgi:hypothetical protein
MFRRPATAHGPDDSMHAPTRATAGVVLGTAAQSMLFTLVGAAGMIVAAFLEWIRPDGIRGIDVGRRAFFTTNFVTDATFLRSAGFISIIIGFVAIVGLTFRTGWITRLAGALGIIAFALFTITMYRADADLPRALGPGVWFMLGGAVVAMFGGFFATRPRVVVANDMS